MPHQLWSILNWFWPDKVGVLLVCHKWQTPKVWTLHSAYFDLLDPSRGLTFRSFEGNKGMLVYKKNNDSWKMCVSPLKTPSDGNSRRSDHPWQFFGNRQAGFDFVRGRMLPLSYLQAVTINTVLTLPRTFISVCNQPPRPIQPSIPSGSVNRDQLQLGRKRQVWFIPLADERGFCR